MSLSTHISYAAWERRIMASLAMEYLERGVSSDDIALARSMRGAIIHAIEIGQEADLVSAGAGEGARPFLTVVGGRDVE